jgi:hypothetical protein
MILINLKMQIRPAKMDQWLALADLVAAQPQIIYIDTPHDGFGPMGEIKPR